MYNYLLENIRLKSERKKCIKIKIKHNQGRTNDWILGPADRDGAEQAKVLVNNYPWFKNK